MLAIMEPTNNTQVSLTGGPTVTYQFADPKNGKSQLTIQASVIVYPPTSVGGQPIIEAPMITIPGPETCVVIWTLVDGGDSNPYFTELVFDQPGIEIPSVNYPHMPGLVGILNSSVVDPAAPKQWTVTVDNKVISANAFNYSIFISYNLGNGALTASHDPTIAVVPDPMG